MIHVTHKFLCNIYLFLRVHVNSQIERSDSNTTRTSHLLVVSEIDLYPQLFILFGVTIDFFHRVIVDHHYFWTTCLKGRIEYQTLFFTKLFIAQNQEIR